jgi:hypothetical protein
MPAFFSQLPLTPPEDLGMRDRPYDYGQYPHMMYPHNGQAMHLPPANAYYKPMLGPILPPMQAYDQGHSLVHDVHQQRLLENHPRHERTVPEPKEDKPIGGVAAKLDYEMDAMVDFVAETAHQIILSHKPVPPGFRKWVHQVLSATRLPSATIMLSFDYLTMRMAKQQLIQATFDENDLYRMLTVSLILGSKFLDDNTFINRSWAEVSTIPVGILNQMERAWLQDMIFKLHRDRNAPNGFDCFDRRWKEFQNHRQNQASRSLRPLNTNVIPHANSVYSPLPHSAFSSPPPAYVNNPPQSSYPTPSYSRYDPAVVSSRSPASAPHTGPTTPEYWGPAATWPSVQVHGNYGFAHCLQPPPYQARSQAQGMAHAPPPMPFMQPAYNVDPVHSKRHGPECLCNSCNRLYMMAPSFGFAISQPVMG